MIKFMSIDIVDACNLSCRTCARGQRVMPNTGRKIDVTTMSKVISKAKEENIEQISMFNWSEPFLHPNIDLFVQEIKNAGIRASISSNLSLENVPNLIPSLLNGLNTLSVSVSGFTQEVYSINHVNGNVANVKKNLLEIVEARKQAKIYTNVIIKYIKFKHNVHEVKYFEEFAKTNSFFFQEIEGIGDPLAPPDRKTLCEWDAALGAQIVQNCSRQQTNRSSIFSETCELGGRIVVLDSSADIYLCCRFPNCSFLKIGNYLEQRRDAIFLLQHTHPFCLTCKWKRVAFSNEDVQCIKGIDYNKG